MIKHTEEFNREAVRIALTSGLPRDRIASDLGVGKSTLGKWLSQYGPSDLVFAPHADLARENERLRFENRVLKEERDILKRRWWVQPVDATALAKVAPGVRKPRVFRGRVLSLSAIPLRSS